MFTRTRETYKYRFLPLAVTEKLQATGMHVESRKNSLKYGNNFFLHSINIFTYRYPCVNARRERGVAIDKLPFIR